MKWTLKHGRLVTLVFWSMSSRLEESNPATVFLVLCTAHQCGILVFSISVDSFSTGSGGCSWMQNNSTCHNTAASNDCRQGELYSVFPTKPATVSSVQDLFEFICSGPLIEKMGLTPEKVSESIDKWLAYGTQLCRLFKLNELYLTVPQKARFYHYYIPVFLWCEDQISQHRSMFKDGDDIPPLVVYVNFGYIFSFSSYYNLIALLGRPMASLQESSKLYVSYSI